MLLLLSHGFGLFWRTSWTKARLQCRKHPGTHGCVRIAQKLDLTLLDFHFGPKPHFSRWDTFGEPGPQISQPCSGKWAEMFDNNRFNKLQFQDPRRCCPRVIFVNGFSWVFTCLCQRDPTRASLTLLVMVRRGFGLFWRASWTKARLQCRKHPGTHGCVRIAQKLDLTLLDFHFGPKTFGGTKSAFDTFGDVVTLISLNLVRKL